MTKLHHKELEVVLIQLQPMLMHMELTLGDQHLQALLAQYSELFKTPRQLPPTRKKKIHN